MKNLKYNKLASGLLSFALLMTLTNAYAQLPKTDTVYQHVFGCDSVLLSANNTVYYSNTTVSVPHYATYQGSVYMDKLNVYNIEIGRSYNVHDTVSGRICGSALPYSFNGHFFTKSGNYNIDFPSVRGCDSAHVLLKLVVLEGVRDTVNLGICANQSSIQYNDITFDTPGTFNFVEGQDSDGCPIVKTFVVERYPLMSDTLDVTVCQGALPYTFAGQSFNSAGSYLVSHTSAQGCQATTLLNLTVNPSSRERVSVDTAVCAVDMPVEYAGELFYEPGIYAIQLRNQYDCDSATVLLRLNVTQQSVDTVSVTLCEHMLPYTYNGVAYNAFGEYYIESGAITRCPPCTLLRILEAPSATDTTYVCLNGESYTFHDSVFIESGTYVITDTNQNQCLDKHVLVLTLNPEVVNDTVRESVCSSELPFIFADSRYYSSGSYTKMLKNRNGCDSARVRLYLSVISNPVLNESFNITRNELPFEYRDSVFNRSGVYSWRIPAVDGGCDTLVTLNLNVTQKITVERDTTICANEQITYLGRTVSRAGAHYFTYHLPEYDSVIVLNVNHFPTYEDATIHLSIGEYDVPFHFGEEYYTTEGYHEQTLKTVNGCDSVVSVFLTINPAIINSDTIVREICSSELPYQIFDSVLQTGGLYRFLTRSHVSDFDSVFYVRLNVKQSPSLVVPDTTYLCTGNTLQLTAQSTGSVFAWSTGETTASINVTLAGEYSVTTTNAYQCSATTTVHVIDADIPVVEITGDHTLCRGSSTILRASGGREYLWSNGSTADSAVVSPTENTTYSVTVTNAYGCTKSGSIGITVKDVPTAAIVGNSSICKGSYGILTATGGGTYRWSTGGTTNRITVSSEGMYSVTATDANGCSSTAFITITENSLPEVRILGRTTFCQGSATTLTATGASSYEWNTGEISQSVNISLAGTYTVTGTDNNGCSAAKTVVVSRDEVNATIIGNRYFCPGQSTTLTVSDDGSYSYRWFDGSTASSINISMPGPYSVTVTNANGCQNMLTANVSEFAVPTPSISGNLTICEGQSTTLRVSGGTSYLWDDGSTTPLISVGATGEYSVTVTNQYGCTATASAAVLVNQAPDVSILSADAVCSGETALMTAVTNASTLYWSTGQNSAAISVSPATTTTYTVLATSANGCSKTVSKTLHVNPLPNAYISGETTICSGDTAHLTANGGSTYKWNNNVYTQSIDVVSNGQYSVTVTSSEGCTATATATVVVNPLPNSNVTEYVEICAGQQATLTADAPSGCTYLWSNGSHQSSITVSNAGTYNVTVTNPNQCSLVYSSTVVVRELPQVSITGVSETCQGNSVMLAATGTAGSQYLWNTGETSSTISASTAGPYTVTATNSYGCSASATRNLVVHALPIPEILGSGSVCRGSSTTLTATGGISYSWSGMTEIGNSISVTPSENTTYTVTVTDAYGCTATVSKTVVVNELPTITFTGESTICQGGTATITAAGAVNYSWSNGENTATAHFTTPGYHKVSASNSQNCVSTDSVLVTVNSNPTVAITGVDQVCAKAATTLTATGAQTYLWSTGDNSPSIAVSPRLSTSYSVTGYDENGCSATAVKNILVESLPVVAITGQFTICRGESTVLTAYGGTSYHWGTGAETPNLFVSPNQTTTYSVRVFNASGCFVDTSATVNVNALPSIFFDGNTEICSGQTTTINVSGGTFFTWSNGVTGPTLTTGTAGTYKVTATNSLNCHRSDSITITVWDRPTLSVSGAAMICSGSSAELAVTGAESYTWSTGESGSSITVMPEQTTTYTVTGQDIHGCSSSTSKVVNVEQIPNVFIAGALSICHGESTTLTASGGYSYLWSTGSTSQTIAVSEHGSYSVTATSEGGCQSSAAVTVIDNPVPVFELSGDNTICENTTKTLSVPGGYEYLWSTGDTTTEITVSAGGIYSVTATNEYGCTATVEKEIQQLLAPFVQILGAGSLCQGESTTLVASSNGVDFLWNTGDSTQSVDVTPDNTTYEVTVVGLNGCSTTAEHHVTTLPTNNYTVTGTICEQQSFSQYGFDIPAIDTAGTYTFSQYLQTVSGCDSTVNLLLTVNPLPRLDSITGPQHIVQYGNSFYSINNPQFVNNYEWRVSNTHWTLTNSDYSVVTMAVNTNGNGILTARGINNCGYTETSINIFCNVGVVDYPETATVKLYPNPVHQSLFIDKGEGSEYSLVKIYDERGRMVFSRKFDGNEMEIDCTRFANGHYTVRFSDASGSKGEARKIIIANK